MTAAQNAILLANVFANMASMYWLAWTVTRHRRAAVLAGIMFGTSPYFSVHLLGHFDLLAGWLIPVFALLFHRAIEGRSRTAAIASGLVLAATAYTAYYYLVYIAIFAVTYVFASARWIRISWRLNALDVFTGGDRRQLIRASLMALAASASGLALWIALTGGTTLQLGRLRVSLRTPQNPLSLMWLASIGAALCTWRPAVAID